MGSVYVSESKKNAKAEKAIVVFEDEASFSQSTTLHQTWSPVNAQPKISTKGQRNTQKIFGAITLGTNKFVYRRREDRFNHETYIEFLEQLLVEYKAKRSRRLYLIQDNASYHKKSETYQWFNENRHLIEVYNLPPYCPEFNAIETVWKYTRKCATHNRYHDTVEELRISLDTTFNEIQHKPELVAGLIAPFC